MEILIVLDSKSTTALDVLDYALGKISVTKGVYLGRQRHTNYNMPNPKVIICKQNGVGLIFQ